MSKFDRMYAPANVATTSIQGYEYVPEEDRGVVPIHADHVAQLHAQGYRTAAQLDTAAKAKALATPKSADGAAAYSTGPYPKLLHFLRVSGVDVADDVADAALLTALERLAPVPKPADPGPKPVEERGPLAEAADAAAGAGPQEGPGAASEGGPPGDSGHAADAASASAGAAGGASQGSTFTQGTAHEGPAPFEALPKTTGGDPSFGQWSPDDVRRWLADKGVQVAKNASNAKLVEIAGQTLADLKK